MQGIQRIKSKMLIQENWRMEQFLIQMKEEILLDSL